MAIINKILVIFQPYIWAARQNFKNVVGNFFGINMRSCMQNLSLKIEGVRSLRMTTGRTVKMENFKQPLIEQNFY